MNEDDNFLTWTIFDLYPYQREIIRILQEREFIELKPRKQEGNVIWLFERED